MEQGAKVLIRRAGLLWGQLINFIFLEDKFIHRLREEQRKYIDDQKQQQQCPK